MTPRLSVVVPFYNVGEYLPACLDSIVRQSWTDFEAILVDDGSPDDSAIIAKEFCAQDSRFRLVQQDNAGPGPARDLGIGEATGEYLAFVDGDDLVSRHGFAALIRTLDKTGSDFAGGNARRFNNSFGVRPSWLHREPFFRVRYATHVSEVPGLVLDRMLWNKVYRRSFWDEYGYRFPAIRYEDYPVALKAHLDAVTVDTIPQPVYYWRERESGESITQQKFQLGNIRDRVVSAGMVMDLVDDALPLVRRRVHAHLAQIDVLTLMSAFGSVPVEEEQHLLELSLQLLERLDDEVLAATHRYDRIQHAALRAGDVELLRRLAVFRNDGGLRGGARAVPRPRRRAQLDYNYPGLQGTVVPQELYRVSDKDLTLATSVREVAWVDGALSVQGTAEIRHLETDSSSSLRISFVVDDTHYPLEVRRYDALDLHGDTSMVGFEVRLDRELLARCTGAPAHFDVLMKSGRRERRGLLQGQGPGSPGWPPGAWLDATNWIQPGPGNGGCFAVRRMTDPCRLVSVERTPEALVMRGQASFDEPSLYVSKPAVGGEDEVPLEVDGRDFTARLAIADIVAQANPDDPFGQRTTRVFRLRNPEGQHRVLLWTATAAAVSQTLEDRVVTLTRSTGGYVNLHESPIRMTATAAVADGNMLVVRGSHWRDVEFGWRRYLADSDDHLDVVCRRTSFAEDDWVAAVEVDALIPVTAVQTSVDPIGLAGGLDPVRDPAGRFVARGAGRAVPLREFALDDLERFTRSRRTAACRHSARGGALMHHHNHYYGQAHILARYAGFDFDHPPRLRGYLQHGWNIGCGWNPVHEFYDGAWRFTWSDAPRRRGHALGRRNYHSIGAPFLYLQELEQETEPIEREGTLWFLFHGWEGGKIRGDHQRLIDEIRETEPGPVTFSLYYTEYDRPEVRGYYEDAGFRVVSFGRRGFSYEGTDRTFLVKQLDELRRHKRVAANRLSTAIFYGVAAGCEPAVYGDPMEMDGENPLFGGQSRIERLWPEMLGKTVGLEAARATTDLELGKQWMVPPAELRMLFDWRERV